MSISFEQLFVVVVCGSYLSKKTYGEKGAKCWSDGICHSRLYFFIVGRTIGWGGVGGVAPCGTIQGYFWNFIPKG